MKTFPIWSEGWLANGNGLITASYHGMWAGRDFHDACINWAASLNDPFGYYDMINNKYWGCSLFDNEEEARKAFG